MLACPDIIVSGLVEGLGLSHGARDARNSFLIPKDDLPNLNLTFEQGQHQGNFSVNVTWAEQLNENAFDIKSCHLQIGVYARMIEPSQNDTLTPVQIRDFPIGRMITAHIEERTLFSMEFKEVLSGVHDQPMTIFVVFDENDSRAKMDHTRFILQNL